MLCKSIYILTFFVAHNCNTLLQSATHTKGIKMNKPHSGYLNIKKIQALTGLSYLTIYRKFTEGKIQGAFQLGKHWLVSNEDWQSYIERLKNAKN